MTGDAVEPGWDRSENGRASQSRISTLGWKASDAAAGCGRAGVGPMPSHLRASKQGALPSSH